MTISDGGLAAGQRKRGHGDNISSAPRAVSRRPRAKRQVKFAPKAVMLGGHQEFAMATTSGRVWTRAVIFIVGRERRDAWGLLAQTTAPRPRHPVRRQRSRRPTTRRIRIRPSRAGRRCPQGRTWGSTSAVDIDKDGKSIWVAERCGKRRTAVLRTAASRRGECSPLDRVLKFDASGKLVKSFGAGMFVFPHGIHVDRDGNIWVTDGQDNFPTRGRGAAADAPLPPPPAKIDRPSDLSSSVPKARCC